MKELTKKKLLLLMFCISYSSYFNDMLIKFCMQLLEIDILCKCVVSI